MSFQWSEYLKVARQLTGNRIAHPSREAKLRSAISRAYYAAFGEACTYLTVVDRAAVPTQSIAHQIVAARFQSSSNPIHYEIGISLYRLRLLRNAADYDASMVELQITTRKAIRLAEQIITALERLRS